MRASDSSTKAEGAAVAKDEQPAPRDAHDAVPARTAARWVDHLDELFDPEEYFAENGGRRIRIRIRVDEEGGVEILADSPHTGHLDAFLEGLAPSVDKVPCG